jgi:FkbM family methyltransferase
MVDTTVTNKKYHEKLRGSVGWIDSFKEKNPNIKFKEFDSLERLDYFGTDYGGWPVLKNHLNENSICYCAGAGPDIGYDISLFTKFKSKVYVIDPTPGCAKPKDPEMYFLPIGISGEEGKFKFTKQSSGFSWSFVKDSGIKGSGDLNAEFISKKLSTLMKENNHDKLDLLKMDIEGSEYGVIDDIIENKLDIDMINVEFHGIHLEKWARTSTKIKDLRWDYIPKLVEYGYQMVYKWGDRDYSFIKNELV